MKRILLLATAMLLVACGFSGKQLTLKDKGMSISFPCRYEEKERHAYNCTDEWTYSYTVWLKSPARVSYQDQLSIYQGFTRGDSSLKTRNVSERDENGYRIIEYDEDETEDSPGAAQLTKRSRFLDIYKDDFKIEVSAWARRDARHGNPDLDPMLKREFEPFFASLKLGQ